MVRSNPGAHGGHIYSPSLHWASDCREVPILYGLISSDIQIQQVNMLANPKLIYLSLLSFFESNCSLNTLNIYWDRPILKQSIPKFPPCGTTYEAYPSECQAYSRFAMLCHVDWIKKTPFQLETADMSASSTCLISSIIQAKAWRCWSSFFTSIWYLPFWDATPRMIIGCGVCMCFAESPAPRCGAPCWRDEYSTVVKNEERFLDLAILPTLTSQTLCDVWTVWLVITYGYFVRISGVKIKPTDTLGLLSVKFHHDGLTDVTCTDSW